MRGLIDSPKRLALMLVALCAAVVGTATAAVGGPPGSEESLAALVQTAERDGSVPIIVRLWDDDGRAFRRSLRERRLTQRGLEGRRAAVARVQDRFTAALGEPSERLRRFKYLSYLALRADPQTLQRLRSLPEVEAIYPDRAHPPALLNSVPVIGADVAWADGYDGSGEAVAVLDTGVLSIHEMFPAGKLIDEACYSGTNTGTGAGAAGVSSITSLCSPSIGQCPGFTSNTACGPGAAAPCTVAGPCWHGTHVAGIAVGDGPTRRGVAPGASLIAIQVFVSDSSLGLVAYDSDLIAALERVLDLSQDGIEIAAVNMSLGGDYFSSTAACDAASAPFKEAVDNLRAAGIATVIASGNEGRPNEISFPGCLSSAISVGATSNSDVIASFSNRSNALTVFAPGYVTSSVTGDGNDYGYAYGTSMATPHVAGAMAVLAQKSLDDGLGATVDNLLSALRQSGVPIALSSTVEVPRIQVDDAVSLLDGPLPLEPVLDSNIELGRPPKAVAWVEDADPTGAAVDSVGAGWGWRAADPATPWSGTAALQSGIEAGVHSYSFYDVAAQDGLTLEPSDRLYARVWLDPANPPLEVMLAWQTADSVDPWEHRAYWGQNYIALGVNGTPSRLRVGNLPGRGEWALLEVPAADVGLAGKTITGFQVLLFNGRAAIDAIGKGTRDCAASTPEEAPVCIAQGDFAALSTRADYGCGTADDIELGCLALTASYAGDAMTGSTAGENEMRFRPQLPTGYYDLSVWWQAFAGLSTGLAQVRIKHANGMHEDRPALDQTTNGGRWNRLGTYYLDGASYVELSDAGFPGLVADAVRFASVESVPLPSLEPTQLPVAYVGTDYAADMVVTGGVAPYSWSLLGGALPPGIALSVSTGRLEGIPDDPGTLPTAFAFTARVVDGVGNEAVQDFQIVVVLPGDFVRANINFQPPGVPIPAGYLADTGEAFGDRGNGLSYGWNVDARANTRDRNNAASADQRYDTLNFQPLGTEVWELAVPAGVYEVHLVAGDPSYYATSYRYAYALEGEVVVDASPSSSQRWVEGTVMVAVTDGRLTLSSLPQAYLNRAAFIEVTAVSGGNLPPSVALTAPAEGAQVPVGSDILLAADASDGDGSVDRVEFYADGLKLGEDTIAPYSYNWSGAGIGTHALTAVATDDGGVATTSAVVHVHVYDPAAFPAEIKINFQPAGTPVPAGYLADTGEAFGDRGNGLSYGWNMGTQGNTRDRNNAASPDQRYDTLNYQPLGTEVWELAVPVGTYEVRVVAGDPSYYASTYRYACAVEGQTVLDAAPSSSQRWIEGTVTVAVTDGRLTLSNLPQANLNRVDFIEVTAASGGNLPPSVSLTAPADGAAVAVGSAIVMEADASDGDGSVVKVEYYADGAKLGEDTTAPYSLSWSGAGIGTHALTAVATDDGGATTTSAVVQVRVYDPAAFPAEVKINFQPAGAPVPAGYLADTGAVFGDHGDGLSYGWNVSTQANTRDRNNAASPDQRYDTLNYQPLGTEVWELAVPSGTYQVRLVAGDPSYYASNYRYAYAVEGQTVVDAVPSSTQRWIEGTVTVAVTDGRLTLTDLPQAYLNRVDFIEVMAVSGGN